MSQIKTIIIYTPELSLNSGGIVALHNLAKYINEINMSNISAKLITFNRQKYNNQFCNIFANDNEINDNTLVIYPEIITGNPLNAKNVMRWILAEVGMNCANNIFTTWGKNDLVYYHNSELRFLNHPEKNGIIYKMLNCIYINPNISQKNFNERHGICYTVRKGPSIHKNNLFLMHPENSFEIHHGHSQKDYIQIFNNHKYFMCYDSCTFLIIIAAMCGCIPIVFKVNGLSKQDWINTTAAADYLNSKGLTNLYGIAYGHDDIPYAESTMHLVKEQWNEIGNFCKEQTIIPFLNDICNFQNMQNTIQNNY